jgi:hypothetical protein
MTDGAAQGIKTLYERQELDEAQFFLAQMIAAQNQRDRVAFRNHLSAFLSSARSVLQYAEREAKTKQGGPVWYSGWMASNAILSYFRDKRNLEIHEEPVKTSAQHNVSFTASAAFSGSLQFVVRDKDGNLKQRGASAPTLPSESLAPAEPTHTVQYRFSDWPGPEDIVTLAQTYLQELTVVVSDGITKTFITG